MQENTGHSQNNNQGGQQTQGQKSSLSWSQPIVPARTATPPVVPDKKSYTGTYTSIFIAGIIIGALVGWAIAGSHHSGAAAITATSTQTAATSTSSTTLQTTASTQSITNTSGDFVVSSPQAAGFAVGVSRVVVSQPTWVVIYEDHAGVPGNALGAELFLPQSGNAAQSGTVELLRGTLPGLTYFAGEALDDGDKVFSLASDKPVRDAQGNPVLVEFTTN
jgi:hypothetical protein